MSRLHSYKCGYVKKASLYMTGLTRFDNIGMKEFELFFDWIFRETVEDIFQL